MVKLTVDPGVQLVSTKSNRPCGKAHWPGGGEGGEPTPPVTGMKTALVKPQAAPPPVKLAVAVPVPVAVDPVKLFNTVEIEIVKVAVLSAGLGSACAATTVAVFDTLPELGSVTVSVIVAFAPLASVPSAHVTVVVP